MSEAKLKKRYVIRKLEYSGLLSMVSWAPEPYEFKEEAEQDLGLHYKKLGMGSDFFIWDDYTILTVYHWDE